MEVCNFIKKDTRHRCFLVSFADFVRTLFSRKLPDDCFCTLSLSPHRMILINATSERMLWHRTNASGLITKFLKVPRIVNAVNLRKFKNQISWFEIEISSFCSLFFSISSLFIFSFAFWTIIRANCDRGLISAVHQI